MERVRYGPRWLLKSANLPNVRRMKVAYPCPREATIPHPCGKPRRNRVTFQRDRHIVASGRGMDAVVNWPHVCTSVVVATRSACSNLCALRASPRWRLSANSLPAASRRSQGPIKADAQGGSCFLPPQRHLSHHPFPEEADRTIAGHTRRTAWQACCWAWWCELRYRSEA